MQIVQNGRSSRDNTATMAIRFKTSTHRLNKVLQRQLDGQSGLAHATVAEHDQLV